jgi:hypothetical protein
VSDIFSAPVAIFLILIVLVIGSGFSSGTLDPITSTFSHLAVGDGRCCHLKTPHYISLVIIHRKYNKGHLNNSTAPG